jgi:translation initiation factor 3 subunit I
MRPLALKGHDRAITRVRLNREGDLLFSASKGKSPAVWYVENGERLGTYEVSRLIINNQGVSITLSGK